MFHLFSLNLFSKQWFRKRTSKYLVGLFSYLKSFVSKCFKYKTPEIRGYLFSPENLTYTSMYLWNPFFQFLLAKFWPRHFFSSVSFSLTPFCRYTVSKRQYLGPQAIQECQDKRIPLYNSTSHLPLPNFYLMGQIFALLHPTESLNRHFGSAEPDWEVETCQRS